ncbi:hypothetical protein HU200_043747 [Digitaria exilis]|uniref:Uncharacterized protein n=1 Tax=Digitaria exilis TaxID=1010633 RepID=A0A835BAH3_9POAL|nr:hypothetical protein HU200_043747 [Digitaria exilis]
MPLPEPSRLRRSPSRSPAPTGTAASCRFLASCGATISNGTHKILKTPPIFTLLVISRPRVSFLSTQTQALGSLILSARRRRRRRGRLCPSRSTAKPLRLSVPAAQYSSCRNQGQFPLASGQIEGIRSQSLVRVHRMKRSRGERDAPRPSRPTRQQRLYLIFDDLSWGYSIRELNLPFRYLHLRPLEQRRFRQPEYKLLPPPRISLDATRRLPTFFAAIGTSIIAAHPRNDFYDSPVPKWILPIIDVQSMCVRFGPGLMWPVCPILITVDNEKIFALDKENFSMVSMKPVYPLQEWLWCDLPLPPFKRNDVTSFAVDCDGCIIFVSTNCATFAFNIINSEWRQSSNCSLPFTGPANYVHALDIFVGLSKAPDTYGHLCFCKKLGGDENGRPSKENLLSKDPAESHVGTTLVYLGGSEAMFCLVECVFITEVKPVDMWLDPDVLFECLNEGGGNCGELDQLKKHVDEGDGSSGIMHRKYLYRLTTFCLSFDNNGDLTTGETCVVQCYNVPEEVSEETLANPVAFWL